MKNIFYLTQVKKNEAVTFQLNRSVLWMDEILLELEENYTENRVLDSRIDFSGQILKKQDGKFGDYLILEGDLQAAYSTYCIKTGDPMLDTIHVGISAGILDDEIEHKFHPDEDTVLLGDRQLDLYYYSNNCFDMQKIFHEYLFLNKNPYPQL